MRITKLIGIAAALAMTRLMSRLLFGVDVTDPVTFGSNEAIKEGHSPTTADFWNRRGEHLENPSEAMLTGLDNEVDDSSVPHRADHDVIQ